MLIDDSPLSIVNCHVDGQIALAHILTGLPVDLIDAIITIESGGDSLAVSSKGAKGLMQVMPVIKRATGFYHDDSISNVLCGSFWMAELIDKHGSIKSALMEYHAGPDKTKWGERTLKYAKLVWGLYERMQSLREEGSSAVSIGLVQG